MTALATTLQAFFTDRLVRQRQVSPNTLCAYRDTLTLALKGSPVLLFPSMSHYLTAKSRRGSPSPLRAGFVDVN
jgi:hypothetical protein